MRILISNDDGVMAPGIHALAARLSVEHEVIVVAPAREQSGMSHRITFSTPLFSRKVEIPGLDVPAFAVDGSPVDCVNLAIGRLLENRPDLVVTGINQGPNLGLDVFPSGTFNSAAAGVIQGIPAIAVSLCDFLETDFEPAAELAARLVRFVEQHPIPEGMLMNLNVPVLPLEEIKGLCLVPLDAKGYPVCFETRATPIGTDYHWMMLNREPRTCADKPKNDIHAIHCGYASVTPVQLDMSAYSYMAELKKTDFFA